MIRSASVLLRSTSAAQAQRGLGGVPPSLSLVQRRSFASSSSSKRKGSSSFNFFKWYSRKIDAYPLLTKCITAGLVSGAGDLLSQSILKKSDRDPASSWFEMIDWAQTARFTSMNVFMVGPTLHYWYRWLGQQYPGTSVMSVAKRVFWDEFIFTPVYYPIFLTILWKLEHGEALSFPKIGDMLWREMPTLIMAEWAIYVPAQAVNFRYIPGKFQVLFSNVIGIAWNGYLSWTAQQAHGNHHDASMKEPEEAQPASTDGVVPLTTKTTRDATVNL